MDKTEFEQKLTLIKSIQEQTLSLKKDVKDSIGEALANSASTLVQDLTERDDNFMYYLKLLEEFNFDGSLTTPTDYFPGIRTISDTVDPDVINQKTEKMKLYATNINNKHKEAEIISQNIIDSLKRGLKAIIDLQILESQLYDINTEVLQDLDSVYDIGNLKAATK